MVTLAFLGTPQLAVTPLHAILDAGHTISVVISRPDAKRGRGGALQPSPVKEAAMAAGLRVADDLTALEGLEIDLAVVVAYGRIIPTHLLDQIPMVNIHFSLLPRWRGAAPVERALLAGDLETGVAIMSVEPTLDTGPVYSSARTDVGDKTLSELQGELARIGSTLLVSLLDVWNDARPDPVAQQGDATYATKIDPSELELDFTRPAAELLRVVRLERAFTFHGERRLKILDARLAGPAPEAPGTLVNTVVSTADGGLELVVVQPEGRRPVEAATWRRGVQGSAPIILGRRPAVSDPEPRLVT